MKHALFCVAALWVGSASAALPPATPKAGAAVAAAAAPMEPLAAMSPELIIEHNAAARGGLQAWHAVQTLTMTGRIDAGGKRETMLPFTMKLKRPHMSRLEVRFQDQTALQVYNGTQGWKYRPFLGRNEVEAFTPEETSTASHSMEFDGLLIDHEQKGVQVALDGTESVEGHPAYRLKLTLPGGIERRLWVDANSFLELKVEGEPRTFDGKLRKVAIYYRDYKPEQALVMPHLLETAVEGVKPTHRIAIDRVAVNARIEDAAFARPELPAAKAGTP